MGDASAHINYLRLRVDSGHIKWFGVANLCLQRLLLLLKCSAMPMNSLAQREVVDPGVPDIWHPVSCLQVHKEAFHRVDVLAEEPVKVLLLPDEADSHGLPFGQQLVQARFGRNLPDCAFVEGAQREHHIPQLCMVQRGQKECLVLERVVGL